MLRYISLGEPTPTEEYYIEILQSETDMFEQATAMQTLCKDFSFTQNSLAKKLGISQATVGNKIRLLKFLPNERKLILHYHLTERHARALLSISPPKRARLIETVGRMRLNVRQTEELAENYHDNAYISIDPTNESLSDISVVHFIEQTNRSIDRLRAAGAKIAYATESSTNWRRVTITFLTDVPRET